jgi:hypothetical protein
MTKEIIRKSFIFKRHWWEAINSIESDAEKLFVIDFVMTYVFDEKILEIPNNLPKEIGALCKIFIWQLKASLNEEKTSVYVVKLQNLEEEFYKIGISKSEKSRLSSYRNLGFNTYLVEGLTKIFPTRQQALDFEKECHFSLLDYSYTPIVNFAGKTECFKIEAIEHIKNYFTKN